VPGGQGKTRIMYNFKRKGLYLPSIEFNLKNVHAKSPIIDAILKRGQK
jgi:hypothetical protein